ncbi:MAG: hypothetical protein ACI8TQ_003076 [Planctomycetota bacterium]|jgi:hypothetical protein
MVLRTIACVLLLALVPGSSSETKTLVRFPKEEIEIEEWMKSHGWEDQRGNPKNFRVGNERLLMVSEDDSIAIGTEEGFPYDPYKTPILRFRFRIHRTPTGTDLSKKRKDDSAFRLYVAFDRDEGIFSPPHSIAYTWTEQLDVETVVESPHFSNLRYLSIGKGTPKNEQWISIERNLLTDYRRLFGKEDGVPDLKGILLKCDSNNTGTSAKSEVAFVELLAEEKVAESKK